MKLIFQQEDLMNGINIVSKAVPSRTTMPILECILIDASDRQIKLTANDMELGIETTVEGTVLEGGKVALQAKLLSEIARKLSGGDSPITVSSDEKFNTVISCGRSVFTVAGLDGEEFPYLPLIEKDHYVCLSQLTLRDVISQTIFSISPNDSNRMMTGELFQVDGDRLKVVSLDGHRVSIRNVQLKDDYGKHSVIVPGKTLGDISRILGGDNEKEVLIYFSRNHILFEFEDTVVISRIIEGEYFRIEHMISNDYETKVAVNRREFLDCIDQASILISEIDKKPLIISIGDDAMHLRLNSSSGSMNADVPVRKTGRDLMIGFNPRFLMDALRIIGDEEVYMYMTNSKSPCFIRDEDDSYIYLILPVNFNAAAV